MIGRRRIADGLSAAVVAITPQPAMAAIDDLQIDWIIPPGAFSDPVIQPQGKWAFPRIEATALPRSLYVADSDVVAADGAKLLPAGTQLYRMLGARFMLCSQSKGERGFSSASNRVCMVDEEGDGTLDTFFLRSMGRSAWTGDQMWFAMNNRIPSDRAALRSATATEIDRTLAEQKIVVRFSFYANEDGSVENGVTIEDRFGFNGRCQPRNPTVASDGSASTLCFLRDLRVRVTNFASPERKDRVLEIDVPQRDVSIRFDVAPRLLGARLMSAVYFE